jgi:hypothetical protein
VCTAPEGHEICQPWADWMSMRSGWAGRPADPPRDLERGRSSAIRWSACFRGFVVIALPLVAVSAARSGSAAARSGSAAARRHVVMLVAMVLPAGARDRAHGRRIAGAEAVSAALSRSVIPCGSRRRPVTLFGQLKFSRPLLPLALEPTEIDLAPLSPSSPKATGVDTHSP